MNRRLFVYGFLSWLIPYLFAFLFFSPDGSSKLNPQLIHNILLVVSTFVGMVLVSNYVLSIRVNYLRQGIMVGFVWLGMNYLLDIFFLLPFYKDGLIAYINQIGISYLTLPITTIAVGYILEKKIK